MNSYDKPHVLESCRFEARCPLVGMSRRKQSNPKPIKREDEEEGGQSSPTETAEKTEEGSSPKSSRDSPPLDRSPPPRVRLNSALARDPAVKVETPAHASLKAGEDVPTAVAAAADTTAASARGLEYLAVLQPAFHHALASAGRLFPSPLPDSEAALTKNSRAKTELQSVVVEARTVPVYTCAPCGIRFSSASTLEAHQTYYCSHRVNIKGRDSDTEENKSPTGNEDGEPVAKAPRLGKQYGCPHCSYSADKKVSLNRHMRMHATSPMLSAASNGTDSSDTPIDRYCQDCDIRFSSVKTLQAHKTHYCSSRHGKASPVSKTSSAPTSPAESQRVSPESPRLPRGSQPFLVLRTNPILIVPYSLLQSASFFTGSATQSLPSQDTACVVLPNGTLQPMSQLVPAAEKEQVLRMREERNVRKVDPSSPLDLSVRRSSEGSDIMIDEDEKENVFSSSPHEDIVCAPSIPALLGGSTTPDKRSPDDKKFDNYSTTPSPPSPAVRKSPRRTPNGLVKLEVLKRPEQSGFQLPADGRGGKIFPPLPTLPLALSASVPPAELIASGSILPILNDLPLRVPGLVGGQAPVDTPIPQVLVKQGVSKCQECNIVFCKHENYVAHKKHYCSARASELSGEETSSTSPNSKSPGPLKEVSDCKSPGPVKSATLYQFICVACGIKFTALDNLSAHQAYYCPKRSDATKSNEDKPRRCNKCKMVVTGEHQCVPAVAGWKCPCCDVISPTAASAQKHMESHTGVRAFRCKICSYKGNTLRGMRTHIRMHFDKKNGDLQEENFITCIVDDEIVQNGLIDVATAVAAASAPTTPAPPSASPAVAAVKVEVEDDELVDVESDSTQSIQTSGSGDESARVQNYCHSCNIHFIKSANLKAHKKYYCPAMALTTPETSVK